jgi:Tfp pilus assembly protein PilN
MDRIDFMPEDYVQRKESHRANFFYLALVGIIAAAMLGTFTVLKVRQKAVEGENKAVDKRMAVAQQSIKQLEDLQNRRQEMMKTALFAAELIEPVPRSAILALLTNALPDEVSLVRVRIVQKKLQQMPAAVKSSNQYEATKMAAERKTPGQDYITELEMEGLAASDIGVADYIASLSGAKLLENVCLVHSMQKELNGTTYRQFKLTAQLCSSLTMTNEDVDKISNFKPVKSGI